MLATIWIANAIEPRDRPRIEARLTHELLHEVLIFAVHIVPHRDRGHAHDAHQIRSPSTVNLWAVHILAAATRHHDDIDSLEGRQPAEQQASRSGTDNADLRVRAPVERIPSRSRS
jgi:hypothetical protein